MLKKIIYYIVLLILPLIYLITGLSFERVRYAKDPDYIYLMNALNITNGKAVGHIDNPGTTVMETGAVVLWIAHLFDFSTEDDLQTSVLENPDHYLKHIQSLFVILNAILFFLIGLIVISKTRIIWYGIILQLAPFFSTNVLDHTWTKVSPEPLLLLTCTLLVIILVIFYYSNNKRHIRYLIWFSLLSGFGLATKATFLPVIIIPFIVLPGMKRKNLYLLGMAVSFFVFTSPAISEYKYMFRWFYRLTTHTGIYGHGKQGFIDVDIFLKNIYSIFQNNQIFTVILVLAILTIILILILPVLRKKYLKTAQFKMLYALLLSQIIGILIVAKHYHANHYLLPELSLSGASLFFIFINIQTFLNPKIINRIIAPILVIALLIFIPFWQIPFLKQANRGYHITNIEHDTVFRMIDNKYNGYTRVYCYPNSLNKFSALKFGNVYTKGKNLLALKTIYPNTYFYDIGSNLFYNWNAETILEDIVANHGKEIVVLAKPLDENEIAKIVNNGFPIKQIYSGRVQAIYEMDTVEIETILNRLSLSPVFEIAFNADTLNAEKTHFLSDGHLFGKADTQSDEKARSGKHSVKLDKDRSFALDYSLENLAPGDRYRISIWRYADNNNGHLVVAARQSSLFYRSVYDFLKTDSAGWKLLNIYFTVPDNLKDNRLKVYLWNTSSSTIYFDDLVITKLHK